MRFFLLFFYATLSIAADFSTSLGDAYPYSISTIATDQAGNTYIVGSRAIGGGAISGLIGNLPKAGPYASPLYSGSDVFVSKLDPTGKLLFTDTFAGKGNDVGLAIALDPSGNIYIAGTTTSPDFPLSNAIQKQPSRSATGFIIKLTNDGTTILYSTYFGGVLGSTAISGLVTDSKGNLYLAGNTTSADFPNVGSALSQGSGAAIYASISAAGDKILYAGANFAGPTPSQGGPTTGSIGVALDSSGNAYFAYNASLPMYAPDGYLTKLDPSGKNIFTANLGSLVSSLAVDPAGNIYVGLISAQSAAGPFQASVAKFDPNATLLWTNTLQSEATSLGPIVVDPAGNVWATGLASPGFPNANGWTTGPEFVARLNSSGTAFTYSALYPTGTVAQSIALDPSGLVHVAGSNGFVSAISPAGAPSMKIFGFQNGFGGNLTARISPAEVISIYGPGIGGSNPFAAVAPVTGGFYPKTFDGVQVTINGQNMPLLYVSANQINAVVPMGIPPDARATIRVINGTAVSPDYPVWVANAEPVAYPTVLNQDGTVNSQAHPAHSGTTITFYATGWQSSFPQLADGQVATAAQAVFSGNCCVSSIQGVSSAAVSYAGAAPGIVAGVSQFNIKLGTVSAAGHFSFSANYLADPAYQVNQSIWIAP